MNDAILDRLTNALRPVGGLAALVLGGSRARGTAGPESDYDLGLYYEADAPLDIGQLAAAVASVVDDPATTSVTRLGEWGPWINGGGWLTVAGRKVDLLYRDLARIRAVTADCAAGRISMDYQPGHPHGFCSAIWMGEIALCRPILDPRGVIAGLKARTSPFPLALRAALIARFHWEVAFSIEIAEKALARGDQTYIAGCAYRALCCVAQVLFALNDRYLINEKGALAEAETFPITIPEASRTAGLIWADIGAAKYRSAFQRLRAMAGSLDDIVRRAGASPA
ncbi:nucleotidyltransferase domain-containing protein [Inquilinus limosus]|uniref:nucleotidyltransferase domain-containing protein n=1 Tax=Inquilinus limosus TaxID=171674 RepID=UPI003F1601AB